MNSERNTKIFVVSGPSGSGKTTIIQQALRKKSMRGRLFKTVSYTTRVKRANERNGRDYVFVSRQRFQSLIQKDFFLEWMPVLDQYYGTPRVALRHAKRQRKHMLLCIDVKGAFRVREEYPDQAVLIFILPPSLTELERRLRNRTTEQMDEMKRRLALARTEITMAKKYDYCIINDTLSESVYALECILTAEEYRRNKQ